MTRLFLLIILIGSIVSIVYAKNCSSKRDYYFRYNKEIDKHYPDKEKSEYYVMTYSWSPDYCKKPGIRKRPGQPDYIQCGSGQKFGYILHGLWPQGLKSEKKTPQYCEGDQPKISRSTLTEFLCMTPSLKLLQHEFEKHGTCMHDERLETPELYFQTAFTIHSALTLPTKKIKNNYKSIEWFHKNNPQLKKGSIKYRKGEWMFCLDNTFSSIACPEKEWNTQKPNKRYRSSRPNLNAFGKFYNFYPEDEQIILKNDTVK